MDHIVIREVGPREGFQSLDAVFSTDQKLQLIALLTQTGLQSIEVTSMVRPDKVPQMADAEELIQKLPHAEGVAYTALYLNPKGFVRAEATGRLSNTGWIYSSPSESFLRANSNTSIDKSVSSVREWIECFRNAGKPVHGLMISTAFGCEIEGSISAAKVISLVERFMAECARWGEQVREVCLADTVGHADPLAVGKLVQAVGMLGVEVSLHLHDTYGLALSNAYAGLEAGVKIFESSIGGLGGCPFTKGSAGNVATEDLAYLCQSMGLVTGLDINKLCEAAEFAEKLVGEPLPGHIYRRYRQKRSCRD